MWVSGVVFVLSLAVLGGVAGSAIVSLVKRRAPTAKEASRRSQLVSGCALLMLTVIVIVRAIVIADARNFHIAFGVVLLVASLVVLRNYRHRTMAETAPESSS
jgi:uncharacterized membrane protein YgdD (TMEM256/DUF423 family)